MAADCKSAGESLRGFKSLPTHHLQDLQEREGSGKLPANFPHKYEHPSDVKPGSSGLTVKIPANFPEPSGPKKYAPTMHGQSAAPVLPADLAELAELWERLPEAVRAGLLATARAVAGKK